MKPFFYVANWKMAMNLHGAKTFIEHIQQDSALKKAFATTIVLCPSFPHLYPIQKQLLNKPFALGAQACSAFDNGPYTGQVSASTLAECGCTYCLIGHSERRILLKETSEDVAAQYRQLVINHLTPIICIGETAEHWVAQKTLAVLEQQLTPIVHASKDNPTECLLIAYEPVWAIGSGRTPTPQELTVIFSWLKDFIVTHQIAGRIFLLYGGSVDEINASKIKEIDNISGFLIGSASLDFQKFKNIVL